MKDLTVMVVMLTILSPVFSQDLIIRQNGDSLNCEISREDSLIIYFNIIKNRKIVRTLIKKSDVSFTMKGFYGDQMNKYRTASKINFSFGSGNLTGKSGEGLSSAEQEYVKKIRSGFTFETDFILFPSSSLGVGITFSHFNTKNSSRTFCDNLSVNFLGGTFLTQKTFPRSKGHVYLSSSIGWMHLMNNAEKNRVDFRIYGNTIGAKIQVGFDIMISKALGIGIDLGFIGGIIKNLKSDNVFVATDLDEPGDISRIDCLAGLKFHPH
ncbi:MAG TPA: hypothetical protein VI583_05530 [Cyclobacteriaceae bacterium]|nr:hypothetical protein [Cyclobacteriaceae bacterium]